MSALGTGLRRFRSARAKAEFALGPLPRQMAVLGTLAVLAGFFEAGVLALMAQVAYSMAQGDSGADVEIGPLRLHGPVPLLLVAAALLAGLRLGMQWFLAWRTARMNARAQSRLMRKLFHAYTRASWRVQSRDGEGHLQEMMASHTRSATQAAMIVAGAISPFASFLILVASAIILSPLIALTVAVAAVGIFLLLRPFGRATRKQAALHSSGSLALADGVGEAVRLTEEMHVYGTAPQHRARIDVLVERVEQPYFRTQFLSMSVPALHQGLALILVILGLAVLYAVGAENLGALGAIVLILVRALSYGQQLQTAYQKLNDVAPFLDRIQKEVRRYEDSVQRSGDLPVPPRADIAFEQVSFSYDDRQTVLEDVSFRVEAGETIGIVGLSGAGKSTLVQLLLRLREPDSGRYLVGGVDVREIALEEWQQRVAYVSQEPRLLNGTVAENIRYFREDVTDADLERAARLAHIHDEVLSWPGGYDHRVGQRLDAVSGGQRQRLCLARALAGRPEILVLDEPTSALDPHSEVAIQRSLEGLRGSVTMFIVAHRMSTLSSCDRIMVLEHGRVAAFDTPANLERVEGYYRATLALAGATTADPA
ncbi:MAG TPA: ABC transporter ATP-binding protein [Acidimicrobiales bacterium]|nr:ABC transporter ATP-binding protein [Acidimicrobiales bacterium]